jgi:DNA-binding response OmpR family regulator
MKRSNQIRMLLLKDTSGFYRKSLAADGFEVICAGTAGSALKMAAATRPDVIVADLALSKLDGFALLALFKKDPRTARIPVILITGPGKIERTRTTRLKFAADDYILQPSSRAILKARIYSALRRQGVVGGHGLRLDGQARTLTVNRLPVRLTRMEFDLLAFFLSRKGDVMSIPVLLKEVWHRTTGTSDPRTVQTHVSSLRRKLGPGAGRRISSVSGIGYRYDQ